MRNGQICCFEASEPIAFANTLANVPGGCLAHTHREHVSLFADVQRHGRQLQERKSVFLAGVAVWGNSKNFQRFNRK